jgi:hypothetical protein
MLPALETFECHAASAYTHDNNICSTLKEMKDVDFEVFSLIENHQKT